MFVSVNGPRAANSSTAVDRKRAASISVVLLKTVLTPFSFAGVGQIWAADHARGAEQSAACVREIALLRGRLRGFRLLSVLSSEFKKPACGCGGIGRRTTLRW